MPNKGLTWIHYTIVSPLMCSEFSIIKVTVELLRGLFLANNRTQNISSSHKHCALNARNCGRGRRMVGCSEAELQVYIKANFLMMGPNRTTKM